MNTKQFKADIAIVGAGGAGIAACLQALQLGKSVVLISKAPVISGTTSMAEGLFAVESSEQKKLNIELTKEEVFKKIMDYNHWKANPRLIRAFIDKSAETIDWLKEEGLQVKYVSSIVPNAVRTWHVLEGRGKALMDTLGQKVQNYKNLEILYKTEAYDIIQENDNTKKVLARSADENYEIECSNIILATGGFANNNDLLAETLEHKAINLHQIGNAAKTGDGVRLGTKIGAISENMQTLQLFGPLAHKMGFTSLVSIHVRQPECIWVNLQGKRFCDESIAWNFTYAGNALAEQKDQKCISIFDSGVLNKVVNQGVSMGFGDFLPEGAPLPPLPAELEKAEQQGSLVKADSIAELEQKLGLAEGVLQNEISQYNKGCEAEELDIFGKTKKYMMPLGEAPFYAVQCDQYFLETLGGLKVNEHCQALNKDGEAIKGLYATGCCASGMYGDSYDLLTAGGTFGFAINSGRIAAEHCNE